VHPHEWIPLLGNPLDDNFQNSLSTDNATKSYAPGHAEQHCTALVQYNSVRKELLEIVLVALPSTFPHYNGMLITHPSLSQPSQPPSAPPQPSHPKQIPTTANHTGRPEGYLLSSLTCHGSQARPGRSQGRTKAARIAVVSELVY
jgi:hypothetical protein